MSWKEEFKYKIGDTVYYIYGKTVKEGVISYTSLSRHNNGWFDQYYMFVEGRATATVPEEQLFDTLEEAEVRMKRYREIEAEGERKRNCPTCPECGGTGYSRNSECGSSCNNCEGSGVVCD